MYGIYLNNSLGVYQNYSHLQKGGGGGVGLY